MVVPVIVSAIYHAANIVVFFKLVSMYYQFLFPVIAGTDGELVVLRVKGPFGVRGEEKVVEVGAEARQEERNAQFAGRCTPEKVPVVVVVVRHIAFDAGMGDIEDPL